jgi:ubiquinone/menaquinone biosynthesis C-methylase UbiE
MPSRPPVQYDAIASTYDQRFAAGSPQGIASALHSLAAGLPAERTLEVGCGTGRWLAELHTSICQVYGLDLSLGMLSKARDKDQSFRLVCGQAWSLPFLAETFDLVVCVNAFHHFARPGLFISEARRLLRPGGALAIIGMDPHTLLDLWYLYDYFAACLAMDMERYPSSGRILDWMAAAGYDRIERRPVERIVHDYAGRSVLDDPFLQKNSTSQLVLLTDDEYADGLRRIERALTEAEQQGKQITFQVNISLYMVWGYI